MILLGLDPGASGGCAIYDTTTRSVRAFKMPDTERDVVEALLPSSLLASKEAIVVYLEEVGGFIGKEQPGSAMFTFGAGWGLIKGAILACGYRLVMVRPQAWQKALSLGNSKGMSKTAWKNKLKAKAQQLYPQLKVTLATADALLILEMARRDFAAASASDAKWAEMTSNVL